MPVGVPVEPPGRVVDLAHEVDLRERAFDHYDHEQAEAMGARKDAGKHDPPGASRGARHAGAVPMISAHDRRHHAIAKARERRAAELAPVLAEIDRAVRSVGWAAARPVVVNAMSPVRVTAPRGVWRQRIGKRAGRRILAGLAGLPVQQRFPLAASQSGYSVLREARDWCPQRTSNTGACR